MTHKLFFSFALLVTSLSFADSVRILHPGRTKRIAILLQNSDINSHFYMPRRSAFTDHLGLAKELDVTVIDPTPQLDHPELQKWFRSLPEDLAPNFISAFKENSHSKAYGLDDDFLARPNQRELRLMMRQMGLEDLLMSARMPLPKTDPVKARVQALLEEYRVLRVKIALHELMIYLTENSDLSKIIVLGAPELMERFRRLEKNWADPILPDRVTTHWFQGKAFLVPQSRTSPIGKLLYSHSEIKDQPFAQWLLHRLSVPLERIMADRYERWYETQKGTCTSCFWNWVSDDYWARMIMDYEAPYNVRKVLEEKANLTLAETIPMDREELIKTNLYWNSPHLRLEATCDKTLRGFGL